MKYIDADLLVRKIKVQIRLENLNFAALGGGGQTFCINTLEWVLKQIDSLQQEQQENKPNLVKSLKEYFEKTPKEQLDADWEKLKVWNEIGPDVETYCKTQREQQEVDLEKFTEKMDAWKARYNYPDSIPIKATMAFTARMFYMYPNAAREWYDSLPKVTLD
jgi:hypothetical protein